MVWGATARILADLLTPSSRLTASSGSPTSSGICHRSEDSRAIASPPPSCTTPRTPVSTIFSQNIRTRPSGMSRPPASQTTIVTPCSASISVPIRSGSPT